ncbi:MAG: energy transducer TonB [Thiohalomonadales bacterium]|nr:energy transducer TonB [Thiohalomonadales bacterium]
MKKPLYQHTVSRRLRWLLGISLLLHGLLLLQWPFTKPVLEFDYQVPNLTLNLEPIEVVGQSQQRQQEPVTKALAHTQPRQQSSGNKITDISQSASAEQIAHKASGHNEPLQKPEPVSQPKTDPPAMNRARILSRIRHDLAQYFYYPPLARRQGMQGTVLLGFGISEQGAIHNIRIVKSSGFAILDLAAQDAMQRLEKLRWYATKIPGKDLDLELPIIFRLTEG